jgi:hypothetical protein
VACTRPRTMIHYSQLQAGDVIRVLHQDGSGEWTDTTVLSVKNTSRETEILTGAWPVKITGGTETPVEILSGERSHQVFCVNCRSTEQHYLSVPNLVPPHISAHVLGAVLLDLKTSTVDKKGELPAVRGLCRDCATSVSWIAHTEDKGNTE